MAEEHFPQYEAIYTSENDQRIITGGDVGTDVRSKYFSFATETDVKIADLKSRLQGWRELLLPLHSILLWEKQWHPFGIVGSITTFFMLLWLLEPSLLTTAALICLTYTVSEFIVPHLSTTLLRQEPWTERHEERYDLICRNIVISNEKWSITYRSFCLMKTTRPKVYYAILISGLLFLAWIGNNVDNMLLTYLLTTLIFLMPGMEKQGVLHRYGCLLSDKIADMATNVKSEMKKKE